MIRQSSYQEQFQGMTMQGCIRPSNKRLAMTAPRPRLHRLVNEDGTSSSSSSSFDGNDPEEVIRKNLFAPPIVVQNEIFRMETTANNHHQHLIHQRPQHVRRNSSRGGGGGGGIHNRPPTGAHNDPQSILRTPPKKRPGRGSTCSKVTRTGSEQFCGLSAEITREISYRTPAKAKTPAVAGSKTTSRKSSILNTPVSRDLFRAKKSAPMTDSKMMNIQLTQTASMSSSDDGSSRDFPFMPAKRQVTMKMEPTNLLDSTPKVQRKKQRIRKTPFAGLSARKKLKRCLTPPRNTFGSHMSSRTSSAASATLSNAFTTSYDGVNDYRLTSTEHEPAPFQVELPAKKEILVHSKICALMDGYTAVHRDFNFAMLSGVSRPTLQKEVDRSTKDKPMIAGSCHRDVVKQILECAEDLVVEGFFREYTDEEKDAEKSERMEACIFSSESLRQIIVCFRGSTANQAKPLRNTLFGKQGSSILHEEQKVPVINTFRSVYFGTSLEKTVFALLANLATRKPFFDIAMTGHSFGAAMATIASFRYASSNSQMRVSCHVFGSPRIGGEEWRQMVHSVPNLRIHRVENGSDPYVLLPNGNEWVHCGHAIQICDLTEKGKVGVEFKARRFDRDPPVSNTNNLLAMVMPKNLSQGSSQGKVDHEIQSYVEKITRSGLEWCPDFCELKGKGVSGANNERRTLA